VNFEQQEIEIYDSLPSAEAKKKARRVFQVNSTSPSSCVYGIKSLVSESFGLPYRTS
jgi:hypothetical protein